MIKRRLTPVLEQDLKKKMVFLSGPRQSGKTTLVEGLTEKYHGHYYNWDISRDRKSVLENQLDPDVDFWCFDELHKNKRWKNWLKGVFDENKKKKRILVTGSARLEFYGRGGDSLQGRYFSHRLHPISFSELLGIKDQSYDLNHFEFRKEFTEPLKNLTVLGGFPEPLLSGSEKEATRWRNAYSELLVRDEVRSLEAVQDLDRVELLYDRLTETVGSPLSINSLREDLDVAYGTIKNWVAILERLYGVFRIPPFGPAKIKAVKKEPKLYFWDWAKIRNGSFRFENLIATHLLRYCDWMHDVEGKQCELRYFRTNVGHEVDFVLLVEKKPFAAIEVKMADRPLDENLKYLLERVRFPKAFQLSFNGSDNYEGPPINGCRVRFLNAARFLSGLP